MAPRAAKKKRPSRQPSLSKKPVIDVKGRIGKAQKSKKRKIKSAFSSSVDFYEETDKDRKIRVDPTIRDSAPKSLEQELPRKLKELMKAQQRVKENSKISTRKLKAQEKSRRKEEARSVDEWFNRPVSETPSFQRKAGESDRAYYSRVEVESNEFLKIAKYEDENECKVTMDDKGQVEVKKKTRRKQIKNREHRMKQKEKKEKRKEDSDFKDFSHFSDEVKFNERIDRPPEVLAKPRKAREKEGMGDRLSSFKFMDLVPNSSKSTKPVKSLAAQERMQEERQRAIDMYRTIKAKQRTKPST